MGSRKYRPVKSKDVRKVLKKHGFSEKHTVGSHTQWEGYIKDTRRIVTVPSYQEYKDKSLIKSIIEQSGINWKEFYK